MLEERDEHHQHDGRAEHVREREHAPVGDLAVADLVARTALGDAGDPAPAQRARNQDAAKPAPLEGDLLRVAIDDDKIVDKAHVEFPPRRRSRP